MAKQRHNATLVVGSVLGGLAGAAVALWKTPLSGKELRGRLTGAGERASSSVTQAATDAAGSIRARTSSSTTADGTPSAVDDTATGTSVPRSNPLLGFVERAAAPLVGVKLGHTANGSGGGDERDSVFTSSSASTAGGGADTSGGGMSGRLRRKAGSLLPGGNANGTASDAPTIGNTNTVPIHTASGEPSASGTSHVAATEELLTPVTPVTAADADDTEERNDYTPFPTLGR